MNCWDVRKALQTPCLFLKGASLGYQEEENEAGAQEEGVEWRPGPKMRLVHLKGRRFAFNVTDAVLGPQKRNSNWQTLFLLHTQFARENLIPTSLTCPPNGLHLVLAKPRLFFICCCVPAEPFCAPPAPCSSFPHHSYDRAKWSNIICNRRRVPLVDRVGIQSTALLGVEEYTDPEGLLPFYPHHPRCRWGRWLPKKYFGKRCHFVSRAFPKCSEHTNSMKPNKMT